jgi:predicted ATP-grasp superfamily ATP-dependent carboligase
MRVLLTEGSGLTSRQVAQRLGELGHEVELLSSTQLCLSRFTRHVRAVHSVPEFGSDPFGWLDAALRIASHRKADLLFPTQEQVTVLSAQEKRLTVPTIVPAFPVLRRVQDKVSAYRTLKEIGAPQPKALVVSDASDLRRVGSYPVFVKRSVSTASSGVRRATTSDELVAAVRDLGLGAVELIAQEQASGPLAMAQAVADRGRLIACHANLRVKEGIGGGASLKKSVVAPRLAELLDKMVSALGWRGGLSMDVILTERGPLIIDVNPRLVEPANALHAGVDLVGAMLGLVDGAGAQIQPAGREGVLTRQTLLAILGAAERSGTRRAILREAKEAILARGEYDGSIEELTPVFGDPMAAIPVAAALAATLLHPPLWRRFHGGAVGPYALTQDAWRQIIASAS